MNRKIINSVISKKVNSWLNSITDEKLKELIRPNIIVTGGCITSMLLNEEVNDFDIYFRNKETVKAVAEYYVKLFKEQHPNIKKSINVIDFNPYDVTKTPTDRIRIIVKSSGEAEAEETIDEFNNVIDDENNEKDIDLLGEKKDESETDKKQKEYKPKYLSSNAITLSDKIQLIIRFYGAPEEIHENYDFVHCTNYWDSKNHELILKPEALEALLNKELKYVGSKYPLCSVIRTRKFINRGWFISAGQYLKICFQLSKLNLNNIAVLEDQLVGVDSAYFAQIIEVIKKDLEKGVIQDIDETYVAKLVDKIFN